MVGSMSVLCDKLFGRVLLVSDQHREKLARDLAAGQKNAVSHDGALLLKSLCEERASTIRPGPKFVQHMSALAGERLFNPVLLCTYVAMWILENGCNPRATYAATPPGAPTTDEFVDRFVSGDLLDDVNAALLPYAPVDLSVGIDVLQLEDELAHSLCLVAVESLITAGFGSESFPESYHSDTMSADDLYRSYSAIIDETADLLGDFDGSQWIRCAGLPSAWNVNAFHVYLTCWVLVNPVLATAPWKGLVRCLRTFSKTENDDIHNYRIEVEESLADCKAELNNILASNRDPRKLSLVTRKLRVLDLLLRRSFRLYYWTPEEAFAKSMVGMGIRYQRMSPEDVAAARKMLGRS